jgi:hypothetical protein
MKMGQGVAIAVHNAAKMRNSGFKNCSGLQVQHRLPCSYCIALFNSCMKKKLFYISCPAKTWELYF